MNRFLYLLCLLTVAACPSRSFTYTAGETIEPAEVTTNEDNVYNYLCTGVDTYSANSIATAALQNSSVTTAKLADDGVTPAKMADGDHGDFTYATNVAAIDANAVTLATDTTGNFVATVADSGNTTVTVTGSGSEGAAVTLNVIDVNCTGCLSATELATSSVATAEVLDNDLTATDLNATLTFADGDLLDLDAINVSSATEGLFLPQAASCASGTAEGQICWDTDGDNLYAGTGAAAKLIGTGWAFVETLTLSGAEINSATFPTDATMFLLVFDKADTSAGDLQMTFNDDLTGIYTTVWLDGTTPAIGRTASASTFQISTGAVPVDGTATFRRDATSGLGAGVAFNLSSPSSANDQLATMGEYAVNNVALTQVDIRCSACTLSGKVHIYKLEES